MNWYRWDGDDLWLTLQVQPRAARDEIQGPHDAVLKVRITAPPVDGKANAHLTCFLAKVFGVRRARVILKSGDTARRKTFLIQSPSRFPDGIEVNKSSKTGPKSRRGS